MLDLLIKNGLTVDNQCLSIGVKNGKIEMVSPTINKEAKQVVELARNHYISAGWIDDHVHCDDDMPIYYDQPDEIGIKKGVTTIIDAGSTGADTISTFYEQIRKAKTNVYAMINISKIGIIRQDELSDLHNVQKDLLKKQVAALPQFVIGLKVRLSKTVVGENDYHPLLLAKELQTELNDMPLMIHIGSNPPELSDVLSRLDERDILTHCFNGKENGIVDKQTNKIKAVAMDAYKRGVRFDIGHGTDSFNFHTAFCAKEAKITPYSLSTDIYHRNREKGPVYDLATTMEKLRLVGYPLTEIIKMVTEHPADNFKLAKKGQLRVGYDADITIFDVKNGNKELVDSNGNKENTSELIVPIKTIVGGVLYDI
ncbi:amidohydrolase/deacetylase family metallohydrolase [Listeria sp. PSOL-1]|uniref:amidohydrolase/deacetylase family metallohydrolase n=1 Tax=Listeria sp. PSOL-1 TaxID=1844999 RepID=UPI0013D0EA54|nr:amidohydrolase/deacetylase family metallohydrolase [Listeria sp. PSOL-1]